MSFIIPTAVQVGIFQWEVGLCQSYGGKVLGETINLEADSVYGWKEENVSKGGCEVNSF